MFKVVRTQADDTVSLATKLDMLEHEGWYPLFPIWNGSAIVFQFVASSRAPVEWEPFEFAHGSAEADALKASQEEEERLREP